MDSGGYDPRGATRFKKLVGTKKWIGTAGSSLSLSTASGKFKSPVELYVAFVSRGIP